MKQGRNKEALAFIDKNGEFYADNPSERKILESKLVIQLDNFLNSINHLFKMLADNSKVYEYSELMWD